MKIRKANKNDEELRKTVQNKEKLTENKKPRETIKKPGPPWGAHLEKIDRDLRTSNPVLGDRTRPGPLA